MLLRRVLWYAQLYPQLSVPPPQSRYSCGPKALEPQQHIGWIERNDFILAYSLILLTQLLHFFASLRSPYHYDMLRLLAQRYRYRCLKQKL